MFLETNEVSRVFKESIKCVSRKFKYQVSRVFLEFFNEVFFCNVLACISSQLPEQKEGLFTLGLTQQPIKLNDQSLIQIMSQVLQYHYQQATTVPMTFVHAKFSYTKTMKTAATIITIQTTTTLTNKTKQHQQQQQEQKPQRMSDEHILATTKHNITNYNNKNKQN